MDTKYRLELTNDGSHTFFNTVYNQHYHSVKDGAVHESLYKHVLPALAHHVHKNELRIVDICFGLGYNTFVTILENLKSISPKKISFFSPELDIELLQSLKTFQYPKEFDLIRDIITALSDRQFYQDELHTVTIFVGNAREYIKTLSAIDIVYQDAFSSNVNKELWSYEYFRDIYALMSDDAIVTTYSIATNVRLTMSENGLYIYENRNEKTKKGTLAFKKLQTYPYYVDMELKKKRNPNASIICESKCN